MVRHEASHQQIDRGDEDHQKVRKPTDFGGNGRPMMAHPTGYEARAGRSAKPARMEEVPQLLASRRLFEGRVFNVRSDDVRYPDGAEQHLDIVEHGVSLGIVATPSPREIVLVRQYRHAARSLLWEIPAGSADPGESPIDGAKRELREETGYTAGHIRPIGSVWTSPGFCSEVMHFFHADRLTAGEPSFDDDERIEIGCFEIAAAWRLVAEGTADAKTVIALFWLQGGDEKFGT
jgi:ADP-ribose pyrophosphatase